VQQLSLPLDLIDRSNAESTKYWELPPTLKSVLHYEGSHDEWQREAPFVHSDTSNAPNERRRSSVRRQQTLNVVLKNTVLRVLLSVN
jgi:hypothetical protein